MKQHHRHPKRLLKNKITKNNLQVPKKSQTNSFPENLQSQLFFCHTFESLQFIQLTKLGGKKEKKNFSVMIHCWQNSTMRDNSLLFLYFPSIFYIFYSVLSIFPWFSIFPTAMAILLLIFLALKLLLEQTVKTEPKQAEAVDVELTPLAFARW